MKLLAGPWVGEFGWELFGWQGFLREHVQKNKYDEVIIASRPGHEVLYSDFCTKFLPCEVNSKKTSFFRCYDEPKSNPR